jgi:hypothetical protein
MQKESEVFTHLPGSRSRRCRQPGWQTRSRPGRRRSGWSPAQIHPAQPAGESAWREWQLGKLSRTSSWLAVDDALSSPGRELGHTVLRRCHRGPALRARQGRLKVTPGDMRAGAQAVEERTPIHSTVPSSAIGRGPSCRWRVSCPHGHALSRRVGRVGPGVWVLARVPLLGSVRAKRAGKGCPVRRGREAAGKKAGRLTQRSLLGQHRRHRVDAFLPVKGASFFTLLDRLGAISTLPLIGAENGAHIHILAQGTLSVYVFSSS